MRGERCYRGARGEKYISGCRRRLVDAMGWVGCDALLLQELQGCMGDCMQFKQNGVQTACLRFVVDAINLREGFISRCAVGWDRIRSDQIGWDQMGGMGT